jgi:NAD(P)-dependent dehydrogenase (short-subunit alcohol dehydrogenase family)
MGRLQGKVAVVAGVGGEIGAAVASRFESEGATVIGVDHDASAATEGFVAELTDPVSVADLFERISSSHGTIDILYNNAGTQSRDDRALDVTAPEIWKQVFRDVVTPVVLASKYATPLMLEHGGSIINTGSFLAGMGAATAQMAFSAAKAAVTQLTRDLGVNLAKTGIRVNVIAQGPIETARNAEIFAQLGEEGTRRRLAHVPTGRFSFPDELAAAAVYLASDESSYMTASELPLYGGVRSAYTIAD